MPYAIIASDKPDAGELRATLRAAHIAYLTERRHLMLAGGAVLDDEGRASGGLIILDTEDAAVAESFSAADPFRTGGLFVDVRIVRWRKSFFGFEHCA